MISGWNKELKMIVVRHSNTCLCTQEAEAGRSQVVGQLGVPRMRLCSKIKQNETKRLLFCRCLIHIIIALKILKRKKKWLEYFLTAFMLCLIP
jgi:hypothetical protein